MLEDWLHKSLPITAATGLIAMMLGYADAYSLTISTGIPEDRYSSQLETITDLTRVQTNERRQQATGLISSDSGEQFSLTDDKSLQQYIGSKNFSAKVFFEDRYSSLAADGFYLKQNKKLNSAQTSHQYFDLYRSGYPVFNHYLHVHKRKQLVSQISSVLPDFRPLSFTDMVDHFDNPEHLKELISQQGFARDSIKKIQPGWYLENPYMYPSAKFISKDEKSAIWFQITLNLYSNTVAAKTPILLHAFEANVFEVNPSSDLLDVELEHLDQSGYLDGKYLRIFGRNDETRLHRPNLNFTAHPNDDAKNFDQVSTYYHAGRGIDYFTDTLKAPAPSSPITIYTNSEGTPGNAGYYMELQTILLGSDSEARRNMSRDSDVVLHELSHYFVYDFLKSRIGQSAVLHEGYADYFAYAINNDPYLGETVVQLQPYLRTADLPDHVRYDESTHFAKGAHVLGQIWSAMLWSLRVELGEDFDQTVYQSLRYLGPDSGFRDALLALIESDKDRQPDDQLLSNKCLILDVATRRGFAFFLEGVEAGVCEFDMPSLVQDSQSRVVDPEAVPKGKPITLFGQRCGTLGATLQESTSRLSVVMLVLMFMAPLLIAGTKGRSKVVHCSRSQHRNHGS